MKVFCNGDIICCDDNNSTFRVLIEDKGKIVYLGDEIPDVYSQVEAEDLRGACLVPAFADTHIHFEAFSYFLASLDCRDAHDFEELAALIDQYLKAHGRDKVVVGFGCSPHSVREKRLPERNDLDKFTSRPLMIVKYDGHASVANSSLIDKMPKVILEEKGFDPASGWFYQDAFFNAINHITKSISLPKLFQNMMGGSDYMARNGIGLVHAVEGVGFPRDLDVDILRMASLGLPEEFRIYFQTMDVNKVVKRKMPRLGGCFATALDGSFGSEDAALRLPYSNNPESKGILFYSQSQVNTFVRQANREGLQIAMHTLGDAAIDQALVAYEAALKDFPRDDHRHILIHAAIMDPPTIEKVASLGIGIALQTPLICWRQEPMEHLETILGKRADHLVPLRSMLGAGLLVSNGSDGPCTMPDPILGIHAACNHPNPNERISVLDALKMHTSWGAKMSFDEEERGTLDEGKVADFVILDKNPLRVPLEAIKEIKIEALYLKGRKYTGQGKSATRLLARCAVNKIRSLINK